VCFGESGIVLCKSHDVEIVWDDGGVFNTGAKANGSVGGNKGYIHSSFCNFLVQLISYANVDSHSVFIS